MIDLLCLRWKTTWKLNLNWRNSWHLRTSSFRPRDKSVPRTHLGGGRRWIRMLLCVQMFSQYVKLKRKQNMQQIQIRKLYQESYIKDTNLTITIASLFCHFTLIFTNCCNEIKELIYFRKFKKSFLNNACLEQIFWFLTLHEIVLKNYMSLLLSIVLSTE